MPGASPTINNPTPPGGQLFAAEAGLAYGSAPDPSALHSSWTFAIQSPDGVQSLTVAGYQAIASGVFTAGYADLGYGRLGVTAYDAAHGQVTVDFTLTGATASAPGPTGRYGDIHPQSIVLTDADGDRATSSLLIDIRDDDRVQANADDATVTRGGMVSGDLAANDLFSADRFGAVTQIQSAATGQSAAVPTGGTVTLQGQYGTLTLAGSAAYSYASSAQAPVGAADHFTYWVTDGDGDQAQAGLTITVSASASAPASGQAFSGGDGDDTLIGGAGDDAIRDTGGRNYLRGGDGNDQIQGGSGFDDINGNAGNDTASGGDGDDWVVGGKDNDLLHGDAGSDIVWGNLGDDTLDGGAGNDQVRGGQGNDVLNGGAGNDYVSGDRGDDTVTGGAGADLFHGSQDAGLDRVMDFNQAEGDRVLLDPGTTYTVAQVGADTVLTMGPGHQMILVGVELSSLSAGWVFEG